MNSFQNILTIEEWALVTASVELQFENPMDFVTPEALIIYEQELLEENQLFELTQQEYEQKGYYRPLEMPMYTYLPKEMIEYFRGSACIPLSYDNINQIVHIAVLPENSEIYLEKWKNTKIERHLVPIYYYVQHFKRLYGEPGFLMKLPAADLLNHIVYKGIRLGASDICINSDADRAVLYYRIRKSKTAERKLTKEDGDGIYELLRQKSGIDMMGVQSACFALDLNVHYRGRISLNATYNGTLLTIRLIEKELPLKGLEALNIDNRAIVFLREDFASDEGGLRLLIGPSHSGKSTTIAAILHEKLSKKAKKAISLELPIEYPLSVLEQMECMDYEDFYSGAAALQYQDPEIIYLSNILDKTAKTAIYAGKAGKEVYAALNANSILDAILYLQEITGLTPARIACAIQSVVFQELEIEQDKLKPVNRFLYFSKEFKSSLLCMSQEELFAAIGKEEANGLKGL